MVLGWDELGDFEQYPYRKDVSNRLKVLFNKENPMNDSLAVYEFRRGIQQGDIIIAKEKAPSPWQEAIKGLSRR